MVTKVKVQKPAIPSIVRQGAIAAGIAIVVNALLYFIGAALGAFPADALTPMGVPVDVTAILGISVVATVAAIIGYFVLTRLLSVARAQQIFTIVAVLVLLGMATTPFGITNAPMMQIVLLEVMHLVMGGALIYFLVKA
ncbi:MAG: hypothetical protein DWI57_04190 [Chloroflexi bacterium]|nr:MAG: hypothetical protein DWI57_04190 [Chloroflexota bacterium]